MNGNRSPDAVRQLAYQLWLDRGCSGGSPEEDWFRAEEMLGEDDSEHKQAGEQKVDQAVDQSFPASDPPAVHVTDEPPVNAGDKWKAANKASPRGNRRGSSNTPA